jgi:hypothetical protein
LTGDLGTALFKGFEASVAEPYGFDSRLLGCSGNGDLDVE